jgi:SAM-dependent methyltransferase
MLERKSESRIVDIHDWSPTSKVSLYCNALAEGTYIHRKSWEYALTVQILEENLDNIENADLLATGAGYERPLYYFANKAKSMTATDLYDNPLHEGKPDMLTNAKKYAPFAYNESKLRVMQMDACELLFEDNSFNATFCLSSIEHFGTREKILKAFDEMIRVTKKGGLVIVATEVIISGKSHPEYFLPSEISEVFLENQFVKILSEVDWRISEASLASKVDVRSKPESISLSPHIVLTDGDRAWTSIMLAFRKI